MFGSGALSSAASALALERVGRLNFGKVDLEETYVAWTPALSFTFPSREICR